MKAKKIYTYQVYVLAPRREGVRAEHYFDIEPFSAYPGDRRAMEAHVLKIVAELVGLYGAERIAIRRNVSEESGSWIANDFSTLDLKQLVDSPFAVPYASGD
ncbi:hypothetical protein [Paraburkholderia dipogonis]|uniref:hypothetical protein n=1 Tax=Paraburkholderia dipogonis TaxID=1211383 RepID=UPI0038BD6DAF